ncbi:MAG TPA: hypothetical protein VKO18_06480 [Terriglobia bacterium]|nr:hypothetical protein [Terriglobia bacterium]
MSLGIEGRWVANDLKKRMRSVDERDGGRVLIVAQDQPGTTRKEVLIAGQEK